MNQITFKSIALTILLIALSFETTAVAQQRSFFGSSRNKTAQLNLTRDAGPWLIMCAAFDGEDGRQQAINLANELRQNPKFKPYVYRQDFDFQKEISSRGMGYQKPTAAGKGNLHQREMVLANINGKTEYAVLVGDYKRVDSARAQSDLAEIKKLQPESLKFYSASVDDTSQAGARLRANSEAMFNSSGNVRRLSSAQSEHPLRLSLLVTNPMIPKEVLAQANVDHEILALNRGLKYTLLDNPKAYTLKVASFSGEVLIRPSDIAKRKLNPTWKNGKDKKDSGLVAAAKRATILTEYLRSRKVEAYQFHDRHSSYVCVGGFDWVREGDGPDAKGNPAVAALAKEFTAKPYGNGGHVTTYPLPKRLLEAGVTCDSNPLTVSVPKDLQVKKAGFPKLIR